MTQTLPPDAGKVLLPLARAAIAAHLEGRGLAVPTQPSWLADPGAAFVTLTEAGRLRGCIGSLEAWRPLGEDVTANAIAAAVRDPRFPALTRRELDGVRVEVSVLSAPEPLPAASEDEALSALRPGVDGVILADGSRRGTFLPQVWEQLPTPREFLGHLYRKAGVRGWGDGTRLSRYTVTAWEE
ncbi:AmmeMemoRadiSam system protein A [Nigerium massiliense]|uniref:AmmeMemoRadiSam system protein A n=1 Tax=Nigerium massiliense TaxID=1522317 RepID=UPI000591320D|nr:AmmeMemoRadiSam system protein A [Nigerium massiliense]